MLTNTRDHIFMLANLIKPHITQQGPKRMIPTDMMMPSFYLQLNTFGNKHFDRTDALRRRLSMKFLSTSKNENPLI